MNLAQKVEQLFATSTPAQLDELLKKSNFDYYNEVGTDILSPEQAAAKAEELRNTYRATLILEYTPEHAERAWCFKTLDMVKESLVFADGPEWIDSLYGSGVLGNSNAGKTEEDPLAA